MILKSNELEKALDAIEGPNAQGDKVMEVAKQAIAALKEVESAIPTKTAVSVKDGAWEDAATWGDGPLPSEADVVTVLHDIHFWCPETKVVGKKFVGEELGLKKTFPAVRCSDIRQPIEVQKDKAGFIDKDYLVLKGKRGDRGELTVELGSESKHFALRLEAYPKDEDVLLYYKAHAGPHCLTGTLGLWVTDVLVPWEGGA